MSVWLTIPSARPDGGTVPLWKDRGYKTAIWRDGEGATCGEELSPSELVITGPYPGYARAVNRLVRLVLQCDSGASWCVAGGDDTEPDPHAPEEIARQCTERFHINAQVSLWCSEEDPRLKAFETFGVMQPTGDRWADGSIDRICGSPWMGRNFCERMYGGKGPLFEGYTHMFVDEELQNVAIKMGVLWQRPDLIHMHHHFLRTGPGEVNYHAPVPEHLVKWNTREHWIESQALFEGRRAAGFPGHEPLEM